MYTIKFRNPTLDFINLFDEIFDDNLDISSQKSPTHDVIENDDEFIIEMELAGVKKDDVSIETENGALTIETERKRDETLKYNRKEMYGGKFKKSFTLPDDVSTDEIKASMSDGILTVSIPKSVDDAKKKKLITIN